MHSMTTSHRPLQLCSKPSEPESRRAHPSCTEALSEAAVEADRKILVQVIPKRNLELRDKGRAEIDFWAPQQPQSLYFDVRATDVGDGEVWIVARQGQVPLVTLPLKVNIVSSQTGRTRRTAAEVTAAEAAPLKQPLHQLFIVEKQNGNQLSYLFQLQLPGNILKWEESRPIRGDRSQYVESLYSHIEDRWLSSRDDLDNFVRDLRAFGGQLLDEIFPESLQRILWDNRTSIDSIMVISEEPFIPWELVHLKEPGRPLGDQQCFFAELGLVRWLHEAGWPPEQLSIRPGRARYVIPQYPRANDRLPEAEADFLKNLFQAEPVKAESATVRDVLIQPASFDLLHFACHGEAEQNNIAHARLLMPAACKALVLRE